MSGSNTAVQIVELTPQIYPAFAGHMRRHRTESGLNGFHFMPFAADDPDSPAGVHLDKLDVPLSEPGWERAFVAVAAESQQIVGHVSIKSGRLRSMLHRCDIGLGVEEKYRRRGLGEALMKTAIAFARQQPMLVWMDLCTFGHNLPAQHLYRKLGFQQVGIMQDRFRIGETSIDDVLMSLPLR
jgi:ribosomal protein S18 acetylase RimI-like enzyme